MKTLMSGLIFFQANPCSCQLESSRTTRSFFDTSSMRGKVASPCKLPEIKTLRIFNFVLLASRILPINVVVVLLPRVPVIPIIGQGQYSAKSDSSMSTGILCFRANFKNGELAGTAALRTIKSASRKSASLCSPSVYLMV